jgi:hypothetical protein
LWKSIIIFLVIRKGTVNNFPNISFLEPWHYFVTYANWY